MTSVNEKLLRLQKMGLGCGPGCSCKYRMAANLTEAELTEMERLHHEPPKKQPWWKLDFLFQNRQVASATT